VLKDIGIPNNEAWLVATEAVADWANWKSAIWRRANAALKGSDFIFVLAHVDPSSQTNDGNPPVHLNFSVLRSIEVHLADDVPFWCIDAQPFRSSRAVR
jgi:hypothetical protein